MLELRTILLFVRRILKWSDLLQYLIHLLIDVIGIRRGVSYAKTEMQVGESKRRVPFLTTSSKFRNDILKNKIYHHFELKRITNIGSTTNNDDEYEDGLESNQVML